LFSCLIVYLRKFLQNKKQNYIKFLEKQAYFIKKIFFCRKKGKDKIKLTRKVMHSKRNLSLPMTCKNFCSEFWGFSFTTKEH